jgi:hypothetical protein
MIATERPKLIYVATRHPRYSHDNFIARWRQHAALGMSQPRWRNVARYLHCDRIEGLPDSVPSMQCDGVAVVVYRSERARQAHIADESARRTMKQDELDTFAQPVVNTSLLLREKVERPGPLDGPRLFVFWPAGSVETALARCGDLLQGPDLGWTRNEPAARVGAWECARVDELTSATVEPLCALAARLGDMLHAAPDVGGGNALAREQARFTLTRTVVLHDVP